MIKVNFHTHTNASFDGYNSCKAIYKFAKKAELDVIAITDHDTIEGAYRLIKWLKKNDKTDLEVIIGEEITCTDGTHIIGLFLNEHIPSAEPLKVIQSIKNQEGLVYFPHPARKDGIMQSKSYDKAIKLGDAFEVFNAKINHDFNVLAQKEIINYTHLIPLGGSDAHYNSDILKCFCKINLDSQNLKSSLINCNKESIQILGHKKMNGDNNYFSGYYKIKNKLNLPQFIRNLGKFAFPLYKNFKERNASFKLENVFNK
ncbi:PHP domain-containing protein [Geojedonia litorea]|uniref:PHP domain-containing protein n=1 Tax=Geojedonia litorea TaxID=1268269 RepID=A0ABV9N8G4_9FLAO